MLLIVSKMARRAAPAYDEKSMDTNVAVVGGGIIGASIAWRLAQRQLW